MTSSRPSPRTWRTALAPGVPSPRECAARPCSLSCQAPAGLLTSPWVAAPPERSGGAVPAPPPSKWGHCLHRSCSLSLHPGCLRGGRSGQSLPSWPPGCRELSEVRSLGVMDANSFRQGDCRRLLYAATSMANHECSPNCRVVFDSQMNAVLTGLNH